MKNTPITSHITKINPFQKNKKLTIWLFWSAIFSIAYTQSPLYTSNQNQYFLHGFAQAGFGNLISDWLANTLDPTPLFSLMVRLVIQFLFPFIFYLIYALLMGVYLYSLTGIIQVNRGIPDTHVQNFLLMLTIIIFHSAGWRFSLSNIFGPDWSYILEDGMAGQRLLGPVLQPSTFGIFLLLSIHLYLRGDSLFAYIGATVPSLFHPTYLLSSAGLVISYLIIDSLNAIRSEKVITLDKSIYKSFLYSFIALILTTPVLIYTFQAFTATSPEISNQAREILVNVRIPHHAVISYWFNASAILKLIIFFFALFVTRKTKLFIIMTTTGSIAIFLSLLEILTGSNFLALLFPWRMSTFLVPLSTFILVDKLIGQLLSMPRITNYNQQQRLVFGFLILVAFALFTGITRQVLDNYRKDNLPEKSLYLHLRNQQFYKDKVFLIPVKLQDFRLETGQPVFVDFKSIPYQDKEVLEWYRRLQLADGFYKKPNCQDLEYLVRNEMITDIVIPKTDSALSCENFQITFSDNYYDILSFGK